MTNKVIKIIISILILITIITIKEVNAEIYIPKYDYVINYYKDNIHKDNLIDTVIGNSNKNKISIDTNYKIPEGYTYTKDIIDFELDEFNNDINSVYSKKNNLSYCINYFYDGIIFINNTECFYDQTYGEEITTFTDKPKEGYKFVEADFITVLDIEENIMNVYYESINKEESFLVNTSYKNIINNFIDYSSKILRILAKIIY